MEIYIRVITEFPYETEDEQVIRNCLYTKHSGPCNIYRDN